MKTAKYVLVALTFAMPVLLVAGEKKIPPTQGDRVGDWAKLSPLERHKKGVDGDISSRKVDLKPIRQDDGIKTGLVIAYGHVIHPPYNVYLENESIMVNGVQVSPSIVWEREVARKHKKTAVTNEEQKIKDRELEVGRAAVQIFQSGKNIKSDLQRRNDAVKYLKSATDVVRDVMVEESFKEGDIIIVCWKRFERCFGSLRLYDKDRVEKASKLEAELVAKGNKIQSKEERQKEALQISIESFKKGLRLGRVMLFTSHGEGSLTLDRRRDVNKIMTNKIMSEDEKTEALKELGFGYSGALDIMENFASTEWAVQE